MNLNGLALCSGGGGLEAGLHLVFPGYRTVCSVERQAYAAAAFVAWMEQSGMGACPVWDDLETFDPVPWRDCVDIVSAGFPCQPYSNAGKGLGEHDPRDGWPHVLRVVRSVMPTVFVGENVAALLTRGYDRIKRNLEGLGYAVAQGIFSAAEVGAPHLRERLFILGVLADADRLREPQQKGSEPEQRRRPVNGDKGLLADPDSGSGPRRSREARRGTGRGTAPFRTGETELGHAHSAGLQDRGTELPVEPGYPLWPSGRGSQQYSWEAPRVIESGLGRAVDGVGARAERLYLLGNGVVPVAAALAVVALWKELRLTDD